MSELDVRMVVLSTDDLDESIKFYTEALGMTLKFRDGAHFAALDGGSVTIALATGGRPPHSGQVVVGIKTDDVDRLRGPSRPTAGRSSGTVRRRTRTPGRGVRPPGQRLGLLPLAGPLTATA